MFRIGIGSKTSTGGVVLDGNSGVLFDNLVASSVGHKASCPKCKKGVGEIVAVGPRTVHLPFGPAAREGDYVACGCPPRSNVLLGEGTIMIGSMHEHAKAAAFVTSSTGTKTIKRLYWSHGETRKPLSASSRFYVDLNLHVETSGYQPGELVSVELTGAAEMTLTARVDSQGRAFIPTALGKHHVNLEGVIQ